MPQGSPDVPSTIYPDCDPSISLQAPYAVQRPLTVLPIWFGQPVGHQGHLWRIDATVIVGQRCQPDHHDPQIRHIRPTMDQFSEAFISVHRSNARRW